MKGKKIVKNFQIDTEHINKVKEIYHELHEYLVKNDFCGYEYDDLLASPLVKLFTLKSLYLKIAAVQVAKRFPINIRPLLGVPKLKSTKGFGFMVKGYLHYFMATDDKQYFPFVKQALEWLIENRSQGFSGYCWGNDFDFASRAGFFPRGLPTIVWTSHIQEAFDLASKCLEEDKYKKIVISIADFVEKDLGRSEDRSGICFAYAPGIVSTVHNSNLLGAVALLRGWKYTKKNNQYALAREALNWSISKMNFDGSWYYGDRPMLHWIDNYHTAYNLDCLCKCHEITGGELVTLKTILQTYDFWRENLFTGDWIPKFYHNRLYPIDIQATAQAIESFARYSNYDSNALNMAWRIAVWASEHMRHRNGAFGYRKYRYFRNNLEPIHWAQSTMLSALGYLLYYTKKRLNKKTE